MRFWNSQSLLTFWSLTLNLILAYMFPMFVISERNGSESDTKVVRMAHRF